MSDPILGTQPTKKFTTARLYWLPAGQTDGYIDLGNVVDYKAVPKIQRVNHMNSGKGNKSADLSMVKDQSIIRSFTLDEDFNQTLLLIALAIQNANLVQPAVLGADSTIESSDDSEITADNTGAILTATILNPVPTRVYSLGVQQVTITGAKDGNNVNLVAGVDYALDAAAGMITVLAVAPATPWTITYTWLQLTDLDFTAFDNLFTNGAFKFFEFDQFDPAPYATETFSGQVYVTAWGDNKGDKFYEFTVEVLITN